MSRSTEFQIDHLIANNASMRISVPRSFYALALIAFGIQQFLFGEFIAGRAPIWPESLAGKGIFAYVTGMLFVVTGLASLSNTKARLLLFISGIVIIVWAAFRNLYTIALHPEYGGLLTNLFKSLSIGFGAFIVAETYPAHGGIPPDKLMHQLAKEGVYMVGLFLLIAGIQHFLFADFVKFLVPTWMPGAAFWTYFTGIALGAAGLGIIIGVKRSLAAWLAGGMVFIWFLVLHLPRALDTISQNEWTAVFEALGVSGLLLLIGERGRS